MGVASSLLQFVESLRENRPLAPDTARAPLVRTSGPAAEPDALVEVARAVGGSRQRLEAIADRLADLKAKAGLDAARGGVPGARSVTK